ncbi:PREDICTED: uncharacterized protein LOC101309571 [Fragaria vesca subsp. vesca]
MLPEAQHVADRAGLILEVAVVWAGQEACNKGPNTQTTQTTTTNLDDNPSPPPPSEARNPRSSSLHLRRCCHRVALSSPEKKLVANTTHKEQTGLILNTSPLCCPRMTSANSNTVDRIDMFYGKNNAACRS